MKRIISTLLVFALAIPLFVNCKKDKGVPVESFSIDPVTVYLNDGDTHQLDVIVQPGKAKKGEFMSSLVWVSDDENIASVDENGLVTAKMRGNTRITASTSDGTLSASCDVNVQLDLTDDKDITAYFEGSFALALQYKKLIADNNKITYGEVKNITDFGVPALYVKDIETAGGLEFLVNLESLDLGGAKNLTSLNVSTLTKLKKLVATKGKLTHVDLTNCSDLESVIMDDNKLERVVFGQHPNLTKVSMNTNKLKEFNASSLPVENETTGLTSYVVNPVSDDSDGIYYVNGSNTNTLTINVGSSDMFVLLACMIYDEATGTSTISDFATIKYE